MTTTDNESVQVLNEMRLTLVNAIHSLASDFENASGSLDPEARNAADSAIRHARRVADQWNYNGPLRTSLSSPSFTVMDEKGVSFIVSVVMTRLSGGVINTQNKLYGVSAVRQEEAHGKAIPLAQADFPEHAFHTACAWPLTAPAPSAEPQCSCPSGDGSLRWPCAAHPPSAAGEVPS